MLKSERLSCLSAAFFPPTPEGVGIQKGRNMKATQINNATTDKNSYVYCSVSMRIKVKGGVFWRYDGSTVPPSAGHRKDIAQLGNATRNATWRDFEALLRTEGITLHPMDYEAKRAAITLLSLFVLPDLTNTTRSR